MTQHESSSEPPRDDAYLIQLVLRCQKEYKDWANAAPEQQQQLGAQYRQLTEQLWDELADDLRVIARGWVRSNMAPDLESLALNMFGNIIFNLPKLQIDPERPVRNLLRTVARRGQIDEYRRSSAISPKRQPGGSMSLDAYPYLIDQESSEIEERMVSRIDQGAVLKFVWTYWFNNLTAVEYQIMKLRWHNDPPCSFGEIAEQLGPGWEEPAVRQRHHRIINRTRQYLRDNKLIDEQSDL